MNAAAAAGFVVYKCVRSNPVHEVRGYAGGTHKVEIFNRQTYKFLN